MSHTIRHPFSDKNHKRRIPKHGYRLYLHTHTAIMHGYQKSDISHLSDSAINTSDSIALSKLKARFADAPIPFNGLWVNEHYVNEIRQGKPLRESQDTGTRCIVIPTRTLQVTRCIYGFHEGGEGMVLVKKGSGRRKNEDRTRLQKMERLKGSIVLAGMSQ